MTGYLGYDPCALGVLLNALDRALDERLPSRPIATRVARQATDRAAAVHRQQLAVLADLAQVVGLVLRADPLGAYRPARLDHRDLDLWAFHRGGRWRAARDPGAPVGWDQQAAVLNARSVAGWLTPERWRELLDGDAEAADPVLRYLDGLADDPAARSAFLEALGAKRFGAMLATASTRFTSTHLPGSADQPAAGQARGAVDALGALWAAGRARGNQRTEGWDAAALGGPLFAASRLLGIGAATAGALTSAELIRWGTAQWRRLSSDWLPAELPRPELIGDHILGALVTDGRAARGFLLGLSAGEVLGDLASLVATSFSSPMVSGALLLASTDPSTVRTAADREEVERSVHAVLVVVDHLLAEGLAQAPAVDGQGRLTGRPGATLPASLGLYTGRQLVHLVDRCDGAGAACTPLGSTQHSTTQLSTTQHSTRGSGWEERQVARLLERLVVDERTADELREAALAGWFSRVAGADLLAPGADDAVRGETFAVGALDGILGDRDWDRSRIDHQRFQAQVAGLDLAIDVASLGVGRIPGVAARAWDPVSDAGAVMGAGSLGELALSFLRPEPAGDVRARIEAGQSLTTASLKTVIGTMVSAQAGISDPRGAAVDQDAAATAATTRPGDNANAGAYRQLAAGTPSQHAPGPVKDRIEHLQAVVGDTMTEGRAWVA